MNNQILYIHFFINQYFCENNKISSLCYVLKIQHLFLLIVKVFILIKRKNIFI